MTLKTDIVAMSIPTTREEIIELFSYEPRIRGKELKSFEVRKDCLRTSDDVYTSYFSPNENHYEITAVFE